MPRFGKNDDRVYILSGADSARQSAVNFGISRLYEWRKSDDKSAFCLLGQHMPFPHGRVYYEKEDSGGNYTIYKCVQSCGDKLRSYNEKECITKCPDNYYKAMNNICYKYCNLSVEYPFSTINDGHELICDKKCHTSQKNLKINNKLDI